ncbi:blue light sensor protein [Thalassobacter stenotrophicus]|nr:blue light sensor protein [Thalassobacter stenotrophicus]KGL01968.1 blue light sensor protein [Thalassobacter sp. 16PALIMAR09]
MTDLSQIIYVSQPFGYDAAILSNILLDARRCNERDGVTGALVCRHEIFLQLLEGSTAEVEATYARILRDDRHVSPRKLVSRSISRRMFADWAMLHDPAKSLIWSRQEIADGALDRATPSDVIKVFEALAENVERAADT